MSVDALNISQPPKITGIKKDEKTTRITNNNEDITEENRLYYVWISVTNYKISGFRLFSGFFQVVLPIQLLLCINIVNKCLMTCMIK